MKHLIFTVTNDLSYDQRMIRICNSLSGAGYAVKLIGAGKSSARPLTERPFTQKRIRVWFKKGPGFYIEYNLRLFIYLLFVKADAFCGIDLDTIIPVRLAGRLRGKKQVYDAHEYFSQQKEIISRPRIYRIWHWIEKTFVPRFKSGYTVSESIAASFKKLYAVDYKTIRNMPLPGGNVAKERKERFVLYQGAVNEARGLESLIPAMKNIDAPLHIYGEGNFTEQAMALIATNKLEDKVFMKGAVSPEKLTEITGTAYIGINLVENTGLNQYYSLANKFFDYIQQGVPQVTMNFPEYAALNMQFDIALLIDDTEQAAIQAAVNALLHDKALYQRLSANCDAAAKELNWQNEEKKLLQFYKNIFE